MFEVTLRDKSRESISGADAYQQEGQMTTFFRHGEGRKVIDCWSVRVASFRTAEVLAIKMVESSAAQAELPWGDGVVTALRSA